MQEYEVPNMEIVIFETEDIITASGGMETLGENDTTIR